VNDVWTLYVNHSLPCKNGEYDMVYIQSNRPCAAMFLEHIMDKDFFNEFYASHLELQPAIWNVEEYIMADKTVIDKKDIEMRVRVISLDELIERKLISNCVHQVNLLVCYDDCPEHENTMPF